MKRLVLIVIAVAIAALATTQSFAQRGPGGGRGGFGDRSGLFLLGQDSVQSELKLTPDQTAQAKELLEKSRESMRGLREASPQERRKKFEESASANEAAVKALLKPEQLTRLNQISLQVRGPMAFSDPQVAESLGLTSEQKDKIHGIHEKSREEMRSLGREGGREKFEELRKSTSEKIQALLTPEQEAKWKALQGEPFKGEIQFRRERA